MDQWDFEACRTGGACILFRQCRSSVRDFVQTAYQIVVLSSAENAVVWDSGKVESGRSAGIAYEGPSLAADAEYFWKVRIWKKSEVSPYSEPAAFIPGCARRIGRLPLFGRQRKQKIPSCILEKNLH